MQDLREHPEPPEQLVEAARDGHLVLFVGAGASMLLGLPSWVQLANLALRQLAEHRAINYAELQQLSEIGDPRKQLSIAELIAEEEKIPLDLVKHLKDPKWNSPIYDFLNSVGAACVTTNYDEFLAPTQRGAPDGSSTPPSDVQP